MAITTTPAPKVMRPLVSLGDQLLFFARAIGQVPLAIRYHRVQVGRLLAEVSLGGGALVVGGGAIGVVLLMSTLTGTEVGLEGHQGLDIIGLAPLVGFISGYANTRELAPIVVALAFAARIGCGYTSRLGAMRINEEIDALEAMSIRPVAYLVSTRLMAALAMVVPLYLLGLVGTYVTTDWVVTHFFHQSAGTYDHYFTTFVSLRDVVCSAIKVTVLTTMVTLVHCYHGFHASGGPEGVGRATGRAIRTSIIAITVVDIVLTLLLWGPGQKVTISG
ncbi:ABC transporter permease [Aeromicrobium terrae]|uniref:ABC transporter permease n=1 Tax=Aeromicrobium terrae TaxID=2498846 RepID=A0A5C8NFM4_9ACTN|nr:ABC transporter permease [Aeromicrobium terrae]TXL57390.1 ABC transporter permease [Aeromicrobium terrae]